MSDPGLPGTNIPADVHAFATKVDLEFENISLVWDDKVEVLTVWHSPGAASDAILSRVKESGLRGVAVAQTAYPIEDLSMAADDLAGENFNGTPVAWAAARPDGSGIDIGLDGASTRSTPYKVGTYDGIPITVVDTDGVEPASRNYDAGPEYIAGADMVRNAAPGYVSFCTTAFAFHAFDGVTQTYSEKLFTADHCGATGDVWHTGRNTGNPEIGTGQGLATEQTDIMAIRGKDYAPYVYYGDNNSNTAVAVRGHVTPIAGASVCYSGAPSGTVCNNSVTHTDVTVNYGYNLTYQHLTRTVQQTGLSAVGNGDSGGPVFLINQGGMVYATGVISGMSNAGTDCQGDPSSSTRKCSTVGFYAPVQEYFRFHVSDFIQSVP
jgi:hypothetical protein